MSRPSSRGRDSGGQDRELEHQLAQQRRWQGPTPRGALHYEALGRYVERLDADIVALQEVDGAQGAARIFPSSYAFHFSSRDHLQRVGFAYKKEWTIERHPDLVWLARVDSERLRYGVDMTVRDPSDPSKSIRLLVVHLKSGCFSSPLFFPFEHERSSGERLEDCARLASQVPVLQRWIRRRTREGVPFAILGDFNRRLKEDEMVWTALRTPEEREGGGEEVDSRRVDLLAPTLSLRSRCNEGRYPDFIDHIILDPLSARALRPDSLEQLLFDPEERARYKNKLSDHCPIAVDLTP